MNAIAAEWMKARTLRSTWWALGVAVFVSLGLTLAGAGTVVARWAGVAQSPDQTAMGIVVAVYVGVILAQLPLGMLGTMTITGEHASGMLDVTRTATPSVTRILLAKAAVLTGASLAVSLLIAVPGYVYGRFLAADHHPSLLPAQVWPVIAGGTLMIVVTTLLGLSLGALLRNGAAATAALVAIVLVLPLVARMLPWGEVANRLLPAIPALQLIKQMPPVMPDAAAFAVLGAWGVVPLAIAAVVMRRS
ncbi:ABC transporter permease [Nonomuraea sp. NBC_01738]|uniref:ABC transporter permease n=1 Tax=Nonomuraea sp. NBC_01738 TaxID=2976003 RepID=UPI002E10BD80|nr:ABC transporter permease [Nonomuraea sp. NBC_01738]